MIVAGMEARRMFFLRKEGWSTLSQVLLLSYLQEWAELLTGSQWV